MRASLVSTYKFNDLEKGSFEVGTSGILKKECLRIKKTILGVIRKKQP